MAKNKLTKILIFILVINLGLISFLLFENKKMQEEAERIKIEQQKEAEEKKKKEEEQKKAAEEKAKAEAEAKRKEEANKLTGSVDANSISTGSDKFESLLFTGVVENNTNKNISNVKISFDVYDVNGGYLGNGSTSTGYLASGDNWDFRVETNIWMFDDIYYEQYGECIPVRCSYNYDIDYSVE